jgi:hypothetical protein
MISCLLAWTSSGRCGKSAAASTSKLGIGRFFDFMYVSSFSVALVIFWASATIRDVDCSGAVSGSATLVVGDAAPLASLSLLRREDDRAEKDRRACFLTSASPFVGELEWKKELNLSLPMLTQLLCGQAGVW